MKLSILIPVYNEEKTLQKILEKIIDLNLGKIEKEIIVVDDASTDRTSSILKKNIRGVRVLTHKTNQGKGSAVRTGIKNSTGDYIIIQDADLEYEPKQIASLLKPILNKKAKVVYGTRLRRMPHLKSEERTFQFLLHYFGNRFLSLITSILYGQWLTDMETCYKLFPRDALENVRLNSKRFDFEPEITAKLLKKGYKILEIPITTKPRGYDEGKKLNTIKDGISALINLFRYRFVD